MALEYIPDYVDEETPPGELSETEVCEYLIRHWCEALEDGNPLYLDRGFARSKGHSDIVAPPWMVYTFSKRRWPWPARERAQRAGQREPAHEEKIQIAAPYSPLGGGGADYRITM